MAMETDPAASADADRPGTRIPLNRDRIVAAAVEIADERGVGAVTMRAVAAKLGVEAMSLYNHVANKEDILDGMVDMVVGQIDLPPDAGSWREAMRRRAVSARRIFGRHPWVPAILDSRESIGPSGMRYFDWVLGTLIEAGFPLDDAAHAFSLLDSYIYGFGIQKANFTPPGDVSPEELAKAVSGHLPVGEYPYLHRMVARAIREGYDAEADFDHGLGIILDGLERIRGVAGD